MTIRTIAKVYDDFWRLTIRIFKNGEMEFCENAWELPKMEKEKFKKLMDTEFKTFDANGVAIHFYV